MQNNSSHLPSTSPFPTNSRISGPVKTLLVVDDDEAMRKVQAEILCRDGYHVLQAESATEALRLASEAVAIHLLITDFAMPELDGLELTRRFRAVHPQTPVLMVSGSLALLRDGTEGLERLEFLPKPFAFNELLHKVRSLLDAAPPLPRRKLWSCD